MIRCVRLSLACALLLALAAGCSDSAPVRPPEDGGLERLTGIPSDTVLFTVDGLPVAADLYFFWIGNTLQMVDSTRYGGAGIDWTDTVGAMPIEEYVMYDALETIRLYAVAETQAEAYGCGKDEALDLALAEARAEYVEALGGEEAFLEMLNIYSLREESFFRILAASLLFERLQTLLYGAGGELHPTQEALDAYRAEQGVYQIKYLRFPADEAGTALAEEALSLLRAESDPAACFDQLTETHSDAPPAPEYADGYLFTETRMLAYNAQYGEYLFEQGGIAPEIYDVTLSLEEGEVSGLFPCGLEQFIVLRLPVMQALLIDAFVSDSFYEKMDEWAQASVVSYSDAFSRVSVKRYYENTLSANE